MTIEQAMDECCALYEAYRRLGFTPDEIHFAYGKQGVAMMVAAQGKQYGHRVTAEAHWSPAMVFALWQERAERWNRSTQAEAAAVWMRSLARAHGPQIVMELLLQGFSINKSALE